MVFRDVKAFLGISAVATSPSLVLVSALPSSTTCRISCVVLSYLSYHYPDAFLKAVWDGDFLRANHRHVVPVQVNPCGFCGKRRIEVMRQRKNHIYISSAVIEFSSIIFCAVQQLPEKFLLLCCAQRSLRPYCPCGR